MALSFNWRRLASCQRPGNMFGSVYALRPEM
jgi:hypothetical protein